MPDGYVICGTPRTGSTLLCGLLADTGMAGAPDSFFWAPTLSDWAQEWGLPATRALDEAAFLEAAIRAGRGGTPVFGLRLMQESLTGLRALLRRVLPEPGEAGDAALMRRAFGELLFLHLSRADRVAQAVSLVKAEQTGLWHRGPDGREIERLAPPAPPRYDFTRLRRQVAALEAGDAAWEDWFRAQGITPLRLDYDALSADPAATLERVLAGLGLRLPDGAQVRPGVARLADALSAEWIARYHADLSREAARG